ncbi:sensor histidine kinase [Synechococcales cyanobacterium C]|uniref:histidine kinase n=1 Tax=Petrachloros mirabilis ULC683 TaxID=2781853 RepID=A0A8K2A2N3_9CYAN|nr:HAMP domain-containing histidine kinase [Petrachloros mirabilis]NCJ08522.1 sensor histidine kinase [Petrachloros mirabilis ULC683]
MWFFSTLFDAIAPLEPDLQVPLPLGSDSGVTAEQQWQATLLALSQLLQATLRTRENAPGHTATSTAKPMAKPISDPNSRPAQGVILAGRSPAINDPSLLAQLHTWVFAPQSTAYKSCFLLPSTPDSPPRTALFPTIQTIPLLADDPLGTEAFCLGLSTQFCWVAGMTAPEFGEHLYLSFAPETVQQAWQTLRSRVRLTQPQHLSELDKLIAQFPPQPPNYRIPTQFSRLLLAHISPPAPSPAISATPASDLPISADSPPVDNIDPFDIELVKAIAHQICTPLTTIHTLTRLLLKRTDLPNDVLQRLAAIQRECSDQIDRFGLIFRAIELTSPLETPHLAPLVAIPLHQVFQDSIARWQQQARRHNLTLNVQLPHHLPTVLVRDPAMLDQILTGLVSRLSHGLPSGSQMNLIVALAGHQLKLQLEPCLVNGEAEAADAPEPMFQSLGDLLILQPETGGVSLSLPVTKQLFQTLGGKLRVKHLQHREVLTIFLPLRMETSP